MQLSELRPAQFGTSVHDFTVVTRGTSSPRPRVSDAENSSLRRLHMRRLLVRSFLSQKRDFLGTKSGADFSSTTVVQTSPAQILEVQRDFSSATSQNSYAQTSHAHTYSARTHAQTSHAHVLDVRRPLVLSGIGARVVLRLRQVP